MSEVASEMKSEALDRLEETVEHHKAPPPEVVDPTAPQTVTIDWDGINVELPATVEDWDPDGVEAFEQGKAITSLRAILGSNQWDKIRRDWAKAHGRKAVMKDFTSLSNAIAEHYGFESAGE